MSMMKTLMYLQVSVNVSILNGQQDFSHDMSISLLYQLLELILELIKELPMFMNQGDSGLESTNPNAKCTHTLLIAPIEA